AVPVPTLPARCRDDGPRERALAGGGVETRWTVACGGGLAGERVGVANLETGGIAAVVRVVLADGRVAQGVVTAARPSLEIPERPRPLDVARDYARLGVTHI